VETVDAGVVDAGVGVGWLEHAASAMDAAKAAKQAVRETVACSMARIVHWFERRLQRICFTARCRGDTEARCGV